MEKAFYQQQWCCHHLDLATIVSHATLQTKAANIRKALYAALEETCASYTRWSIALLWLNAAASATGLLVPGEPQFMADLGMAGP